METKTRETIGYLLLAIALFTIFIAPAILLWDLWKGSFLEFSYWKIQIGWLFICGISMIVLQDKEEKNK